MAISYTRARLFRQTKSFLPHPLNSLILAFAP